VTARAPVNNLAAAPGPYPGEVVLTWTAPGDDGMTGTASLYEIKVAHVPITGANLHLGSRRGPLGSPFRIRSREERASP
jgi:hypothetical protein